MDTLQSVLNTLGADIKLYRDRCPPGAEVPGPWAVSLDLQDAYFHVPVDPRDTKYLRFAYDGEIFEFQVLPLGLSTAPRTFTHLVRAVGAFLKTLGINVFQYLNDWLVVGETYQLALSYRDTVRWVTPRVGFVLNEEKSDWVPSQFPLFLGSSLDLVRLLAFPSEDRIDRLRRLIRRVLKSPASPARLWRLLFGHLASMIQLVPGARRHIRPLQYFVQERWDMSMPEFTPVFLIPAARETLQWWLHTPNLMSGVPFSDPVPEMTIVTDASSYGCGGHLGDQTASGTWQLQWKSRHINWLELQAVLLTLQHFLPQLRGTVMEVLSDNMTTVSYINKQGGTHSLSLCRLALDLWEWCDEHRIVISAVHLAGESNVLADALSRGIYLPTEWTLHRLTYESLWQVWERPFVDMFASAKNAHFSGVLLPGIGPPGQRVEYADHELGYGSRLCVPSYRTDSAGVEETPPAPVCDDRPGRSILAQPDLVQTKDESPERSAQGDPGSVESPEELGDTRVLPGACKTEIDCAEALRRSILAQGFSEKVADTAAKGRPESTRRIYGDRASHFARWCAARAVDPYNAPVTEVADFLTDLAKMPHKGKPMAHSTIVFILGLRVEFRSPLTLC